MARITQRPGEKPGAVPTRDKPRGGSGYLTRVAASIAFAVSMLHWFEVPSHLAKQTYLGALFVLGSTALLYTSLALLKRPSLLAWWIGAGTMVGMFAGGLASRTTGLPDVMFKTWGPPLILSLALELGFLVIWLYEALGTRNTGATADEPSISANERAGVLSSAGSPR